MIYRAYSDPDRAACLAIFDSNAVQFFSPGDRAEFEGFLGAPPGFFGVLCEDEGHVVACGGIRVRDNGETAGLTWGMVHAGRQGEGLGKALTRCRLLKLIEFPGVKRVVLNTSNRTVDFYLKLGFRVLKHIPDGYRSGLDRYNLELTLASALPV
jgi:ribosomal protein S18 acetylase RimI-like enzyme